VGSLRSTWTSYEAQGEGSKAAQVQRLYHLLDLPACNGDSAACIFAAAAGCCYVLVDASHVLTLFCYQLPQVCMWGESLTASNIVRT
jgi:hypothetical protein